MQSSSRTRGTGNSLAVRCLELDALRGIAATIVVVSHFMLHRTNMSLSFNMGKTGVDIFFIISGFVIFMTLNKARTAFDFVASRVSRLYPTYWACVTFTFTLKSLYMIFVAGKGNALFIVQYLGNMTMFQSYLGIPNLEAPYWTMTVEMFFYMFMLGLFHFNWLRFLKVIGLALCGTVAGINFFWGDVALVGKALVSFPILVYLPLFLSGTVFYELHTQKTYLFKNYGVIIFYLILQFSLLNQTGEHGENIGMGQYAFMLAGYFVVFALFVHNKLGFLVVKPLLFLGRVSFALYLMHMYVSNAVLLPIFEKKLHLGFWLSAAITFPIVLLGATLITIYIGEPFAKTMRKKLAGKPKMVIATL
jgi:peptidoglycan/LPS O-acetylase OafA/YrhL